MLSRVRDELILQSDKTDLTTLNREQHVKWPLSSVTKVIATLLVEFLITRGDIKKNYTKY